MNLIVEFFQYAVFFYTTALVLCYCCLIVLGYSNSLSYRWKHTKKEDQILKNSPLAPGISVIAPAFNEEKSIIANVNSMLTLDYPLFEVIIVNDGSKDKTLDLLIEAFELVETPFAYVEKIKTQPFKRIFKSTNSKFEQLTVVDKENGGTKADATNAGINASSFPYFLCTDVDCILSRDALLKMIQPFLNAKPSVPVIAVGATMRMANSCEIQDGVMTRVKAPTKIIPSFQEIEYLRSYLIGKMGWSVLNSVPNVSGGLGMFDKAVVIHAGGYDPNSHAEDIDLTLRIIAYMRNFGMKYKIVQIPYSCCWTEGPPTVGVLNKQRTRWGRGLLQIIIVHRKFLFNRKYGRMGLVTMPYIFFFEFLAPIIELVGIVFMAYIVITKQINLETAYIMFLYVYLLGVVVSMTALMFDKIVEIQYRTFREYLRLFLISFLEALIYHPLIIFFSMKGYIDFLTRQNFEWGTMKRQGFEQKS